MPPASRPRTPRRDQDRRLGLPLRTSAGSAQDDAMATNAARKYGALTRAHCATRGPLVSGSGDPAPDHLDDDPSPVLVSDAVRLAGGVEAVAVVPPSNTTSVSLCQSSGPTRKMMAGRPVARSVSPRRSNSALRHPLHRGSVAREAEEQRRAGSVQGRSSVSSSLREAERDLVRLRSRRVFGELLPMDGFVDGNHLRLAPARETPAPGRARWTSRTPPARD